MEENVKARYSDAELMEFKKLIEEKLEIAKKEFEFTNAQISELNGNNSDRDGGDLLDDSNKQAELEMLNSMLFRQKQFIRNLENALHRIRNKTYGICTVTGQLIDKKRLMLVPHATKSIEGKSAENSPKSNYGNKTGASKKIQPGTQNTNSGNKTEGSVSDGWDEDDTWNNNSFDDFDTPKFNPQDKKQDFDFDDQD